MKTLGNLLKTGVLFILLTGLLVVVGYFVGGKNTVVPFFIISLVMNLTGYWFSASIALKMARARPLDESENPSVYADTRELVERMNLPMPRIFVSGDPQPNAFATGRGPHTGVVCLTRGIQKLLNRQELKAVLAHELAHIKNRDVLTGTIAALVAGSISTLAQVGLFTGGDDEDRNPIISLIAIIAAPIAATIIQLAISRSREYVADQDGAYATRQPHDLATALEKIDTYARQLPSLQANPALSSLYIQNPFREKGMIGWFSTHPPTEERVARLRAMDVN